MTIPVLLLLASCGGTPLPGEKLPPPEFAPTTEYQPPSGLAPLAQPASELTMLTQYQPAPVPPRMTPPQPPAHPPTPLTKDYGHWQREESQFRFIPGAQTNPIEHRPIWVPGRWVNDSSGNRVWNQGYWR
jgi:hypothetical protein